MAVRALQTYFNILGHISLHILLRTLYIISLHSVRIAVSKHNFQYFENRKIIEIQGVEGERWCLRRLFSDAIFHFNSLYFYCFFTFKNLTIVLGFGNYY